MIRPNMFCHKWHQLIPHPLRFFVPSQLVRALSVPPPPWVMGTLPPAASRRPCINSLVMLISSQSCPVRFIARSHMKLVVPLQEISSNNSSVAFIRCSALAASRLFRNASAMMPQLMMFPSSAKSHNQHDFLAEDKNIISWGIIARHCGTISMRPMQNSG